MKLKLFALLIVLVILAACSPTFPLVQDTRPPTATPEPTRVCEQVKGNIGEKGERIYFTKKSINYNNVKISLPGEQMFCSTEEAEAAGFRPAKR